MADGVCVGRGGTWKKGKEGCIERKGEGDLHKGLEDGRALLFCEARARVGDGELQHAGEVWLQRGVDVGECL